MKSLLIKLLMPSPEAIAKLMAAAIARTVNNYASGKEEVIGRYSRLAMQVNGVVTNLGKILVDGKVDAAEESAIAALLEPLAEKAVKLI